MIDFSAEVEILAPPFRVWDVLTEFTAYPKWNPYIAVRGTAGFCSGIQWAYSSQLTKRVWTSATSTEFDARNAITWSFGIRWLFRFEERYHVHSTREGTKLTHSVRCQGIAARLGRRSLLKTFVGVTTAANEGLRRYIEGAGLASLKSPSVEPRRQAKAKKQGFRARSKRR